MKNAQALGRLAAGKPKKFTQAERARRRKRLAEARKRRWLTTARAGTSRPPTAASGRGSTRTRRGKANSGQ